MCIINDIGHYRTKPPPSPSYTLADLERLAHEYADGSDASSSLQSSEDALKFRLYLGMFIVWLGKKEREANERNETESA